MAVVIVAVVIVAVVIVVFIVCGVWEAFASDIHTIGEESIATPHPEGGFKLTITPSGDWIPFRADLLSDQFRVGDGWSDRYFRNTNLSEHKLNFKYEKITSISVKSKGKLKDNGKD